MTATSDWDLELAAIARELATLSATYGRTRLTAHKTLMLRRIGVMQAQLRLERLAARLAAAVRKEPLLLPRERALLHGARLYAEKLPQEIALTARLQSRQLWLQLIRARMSGPQVSGLGDLSGDDLVALAIRHDQAQKTERYLRDAVTKLAQKQRQLTERYQQLAVVDANSTAAQTLGQRLGASLNAGVGHPTITTLERWLKVVASRTPSRTTTERGLASADALEEGLRRASDLAQGLAARQRETATSPPPKRQVDRLGAALAQLDELQEEARLAYEQIMQAAPMSAQPILVRGGVRQATKTAGESSVARTNDSPHAATPPPTPSAIDFGPLGGPRSNEDGL